MKPVDHVAIINRSPLGDGEVAICVEAYREWIQAVAAAWRPMPAPGLALYGTSHRQAIKEEAALIIIDSGNVPDAFGWHTALGLARYGYVDLGMCRQWDEPWSRVFGHELGELAVDPDGDAWEGPYPDGFHVAKEIGDPVQRNSVSVEASYLGRKARVELADFVLPSWFELGAPGPYSHQGNAPAPLTIAPGGYFLRERNGLVTSEGALRVKSYGRTLKRLKAGRVPAAT